MRPDAPRGFGYKMGWLALPAADSDRVVAALGLDGFVPATWAQGLDGAYAGLAVFVSPPIDGWVLVVGWWVMDMAPLAQEELVTRLAGELGEAQLFLTDRVQDAHRFVRVRAGELERSNSITAASEADVMARAAEWSLDPTRLDGRPAAGLGRAAPAPDLRGAQELDKVRGPARMVAAGAASSAWQAELSIDALPCPSCGQATLGGGAGRRGLPWEAFAYQIDSRCTGCRQRVLIRFTAGPGWDTQPGPDEPAITGVMAPSPLVGRERLERLLQDQIGTIDSMTAQAPELGWDAGELAEALAEPARRALAALRELEKLDPALTVDVDHAGRKQRMEKLLAR